MTKPTLWIGIRAESAHAAASGDDAGEDGAQGTVLLARGAKVPIPGMENYVVERIVSEGTVIGYGHRVLRDVHGPIDMDTDRWTDFREKVRRALASAGVTGPVDICIEPVDIPYTIH